MALSPKLELRQGQSLVMTPQLQQAIKMLQLSNIDLAAYVESELERNPLLERSEENTEPLRTGEPANTSEEATPATDSVDASTAVKTAELDADHEATFPEDTPIDRAGSGPDDGPSLGLSSSSAPSGGVRLEGEDPLGLEGVLTKEVTLRDHLKEQLALATLSAHETLVAHAMIDNLDESGYFRTDIVTFAERIGATIEMADEVLSKLQGFDPSGVFARDLRECLSIQLKDRNRFDPAMAMLIDNLELVARRDMGKLRDLCEVDDEDLADMLVELQALNPKPGQGFDGAPIQSVVPDVVVTRRHDGSWGIELNTEMLPRVLVNQSYYATVSQTAKRDEDQAYLTDCLQDANWLVKSLEQRARTILKVSTEIVRQQDAFMNYGVSHLRPLNLKTVADAISMHESTVSRVTSNKYMDTPRGLFELKYFFSAAISAIDGGQAHSAEAVRHTIRDLIEKEAADRILSDDTIVKILRDQGVDIARRTVAKYRESMRIPSSVQRRREKKAGTR